MSPWHKTADLIRNVFSKRKSPGPGSAVPPGYTGMGEFSEQDIFIAGYPKSGNTWFQDLISAVVHGMMPEYCPPKLVQDLVPDVHAKTFYNRYATPMYFKTHHLPRPEYRRVVHLLRDGRDVMVSYYHHLCVMQEGPVDFLQVIQTGDGLFPCKWHEHVTFWLQNPYQADILTVRYEDLKKDTSRELARFCQFANLNRDSAMLQRIAEATAFEKMRAKEARLGTGGDPRWPRDKRFRRRGQVGSYKDEMPPEVLWSFLAEAGPTLGKAGYA